MTEALLVAEHLTKSYDTGVTAVREVSLSVQAGETLGLVGESGCGKSTTAKLVLRLLKPDRGTVTFAGRDLARASRRELRRARAKLQFVPQNPQTSLNPRLPVGESISFNLAAHGIKDPTGRRVSDLLDRVGVPPVFASRYPRELSGGQLQRAAIARALATDPDLVVCDEAVSALDKSVQAQVLNLLAELQSRSGIAILFVSHDLAVVEHIADRVVVMRAGSVVEVGPTETVWRDPQHLYTRELLAAVPGRGLPRTASRHQKEPA